MVRGRVLIDGSPPPCEQKGSIMRVTVQELQNVISRLPPARSYRHNLINIAIQGEGFAVLKRSATSHSDLRVVTFRKMQPLIQYSLPEWELILA